ncbi:MAG: LysM peptidoglycan-binding domain-containing protein [Anaerolineae bacterium]|nr:LysM peptidoglycan-binding domain-containing protein [Anaerolineae bacterium]
MDVKKLFSVLFGLTLVTGLVLAMAVPAMASPPSQVYYQTPTAGADGRIVYIVKAGDSCLSIALLTGMDVNELRRINNLDEECFLAEGQKLLLGVLQEPEATPGPSPTPTTPLPSPTPFNGNGRICILLFEDVNGNALAEENEVAIPDGVVGVSDRSGKVSLTGKTTSQLDENGLPVPVCFDELPENEYNVSVALPEGYNPTTALNYNLKLNAGDLSTIDFGAQLNSEAQPAAPGEGGRSPLLGLLGGLLVLGGIGLGVYFALLRRKPPLE